MYGALGWFAVIITLVGVFLLRSEVSIGVGFPLLLTGIILAVFSAIQRYRVRKQLLHGPRTSLGEPKVDTDRMEKHFEDVRRSYEKIVAMNCDACGASYEVERQALHEDPQRGYYDVFHLRCTNCGRKRIFESDLPHLEGMAWYEKPGET